MKLLTENKQALRFIGVFIAVYILLNSGYGLFVNHYAPTSDPFTQWIARQVVWCLGYIRSILRDAWIKEADAQKSNAPTSVILIHGIGGADLDYQPKGKGMWSNGFPNGPRAPGVQPSWPPSMPRQAAPRHARWPRA